VLHNTKFLDRLVAMVPTITVLVVGACRAMRQQNTDHLARRATRFEVIIVSRT
jgi:hypothetical protein